MDFNKVEAVQAWLHPRSLLVLRVFLCLTGYYCKFIKEYGLVAAPLTKLLKKEAFSWTSKAYFAFTTLKAALISAQCYIFWISPSLLPWIVMPLVSASVRFFTKVDPLLSLVVRLRLITSSWPPTRGVDWLSQGRPSLASVPFGSWFVQITIASCFCSINVSPLFLSIRG